MSTTLQDPVDRMLDAAQNGKSIIKNRDILHSTHIPDVIYHRDLEQKQVTQSLLPILKQSRPSNLLVYGKPGTGKTLVVKKILSKIRERVAETNFPIKLVYANAKNETTMYGLLVSFARQLGLNEKDIPPTGLAISEVRKRLFDVVKQHHINAIFIIDEIDHLAGLIAKTRKNDILYNLTRPSEEEIGSGSLTIVGISNDLKFKDKLDPRVISTLSEEEVVFTNYTVEQIQEILEDRVGEAFLPSTVAESALRLCAAMAGQQHGDARRAIDLLRVAGEIAEREQSETVTEEHIRASSQKIDTDTESAVLRGLPLHDKLLVWAVMRVNGASTGEIYATYKTLSRTTGQKELTQRRVTQMLSDLGLSGIISGRLVSQGMHGRTKKFKLGVSQETIKEAFQDDPLLEDFV